MPGMVKASMATKCIDQIPPPRAMAAAVTHICRIQPVDARMRVARLSAVNDANMAIRIDRITRDMSWVPRIIMGVLVSQPDKQRNNMDFHADPKGPVAAILIVRQISADSA